MNTYVHLLRPFPRIAQIHADLGRLMENCAANAGHAHGVSAVGLRQKALRQRFLIATTAHKVFPQLALVIISED
jgi:hypothetical protein